MDLSVVLAVLTGAAIVGVMVWLVVKGGSKVETVEDALHLFWQAEQLVQTYAPAADQLLATGKLKPEERLDYVIRMVFTYVEGLDIDQVRGIVEAWVAEHKDH